MPFLPVVWAKLYLIFVWACVHVWQIVFNNKSMDRSINHLWCSERSCTLKQLTRRPRSFSQLELYVAVSKPEPVLKVKLTAEVIKIDDASLKTLQWADSSACVRGAAFVAAADAELTARETMMQSEEKHGWIFLLLKTLRHDVRPSAHKEVGIFGLAQMKLQTEPTQKIQ